MKWSGDQDADGYQVTNIKLDQVVALPGFTDPDDRGRYIFVTNVADPDFGPWIGGNGAWARPESFGGGGAANALLEPGLIGWHEGDQLGPPPRQGFDPLLPAIVYTMRALTVDEVILLTLQEDIAAVPTTLPPGLFVAQYVWGDQFANEVWWPLTGPFSVQLAAPIKGHLAIYDTNLNRYVDQMTAMVIP